MNRRSAKLLIGIFLLGMCGIGALRGSAQQAAAPTASTYTLEQFGSIKAADVQATFDAAMKAIMAAGGGTLILSKDVPTTLALPSNTTQEAWRTPAAPAPATRWGFGNGVTIYDYRSGTSKVYLPQLSGMEINRTLDLPEGDCMGSWAIAPMITLNNKIVRGSTSYRDLIADDVPEGKDQRFFVRTIRGIFPGEFLNVEYSGAGDRLYVKSVGFDKATKRPYFVADSTSEHTTGGTLSNKNHVNLMFMKVNSHTEEQTFDMWIERHKYSQGDTYLYEGRFFYNSDVHSTGGDENGVIYAAFPISEVSVFHGTVSSFDTTTNALKFEGIPNTLGTGRPMINLNQKKWITQGTLIMVRPGSWTSPSDLYAKDPVFEGKTYPTTFDPKVNGLRFGGLMRFSKDAPLTEAVVGRYFAVDTPEEKVNNTAIRRWYYIDGFKQNPDGTKEITVTRHWWGAKTAGSVTLYREDNYTSDGHIVPLKYVIAPGANVYDVADAVDVQKNTVKVAPGPDTGTPFDFEKGDSLEQAIGPDPFKPIPFRAWCGDQVPGVFPSPIFDVSNTGSVQRYTALWVHGGSGKLEDISRRNDRRTPFGSAVNVQSVTDDAITFEGDVMDAALLFKQPNKRAQPMKWLVNDGKQETTLAVSPTDGTLEYRGGATSLPAGVVNTGGLSASATPARNLRGLNLPVKAGGKELAVLFPRPEADNNYMVVLQLSWLTNYAITNRAATGFTVQFATPPAKAEELSWLLVR